MTVHTESRVLHAVIEQFKLNTRLFNNVIEEITEEKSNIRLSELTNNIKWITGHIINARYGVGGLIGIREKDPNEDMFEHGKGLDPGVNYPLITTLKKQWNDFSPTFIEHLVSLNESDVEKNAPFKLPIDDNSILGAISFFAHHETYHIGQLGFMRKFMDFGQMKYS